jgi:DNA-binding protein HU-beta
MNKTQLVDAIAAESGLSRNDAAKALDAFVTNVSESLKNGDEVAITGFGKFSVAQRSARTGRNPQTGETMTIQASKSPKFTAGAGLKDLVAGRK